MRNSPGRLTSLGRTRGKPKDNNLLNQDYCLGLLLFEAHSLRILRANVLKIDGSIINLKSPKKTHRERTELQNIQDNKCSFEVSIDQDRTRVLPRRARLKDEQGHPNDEAEWASKSIPARQYRAS